MGVSPRGVRIGAWLRGVVVVGALFSGVRLADAAPRVVPGPRGVRWSGAALSGRPRTGAPVRAWRAATRDTGLVGLAVRTALADSLAAAGDTLGADSLLKHPRLVRSLWGFDALMRRAGYRLSHGDTLGAVRLLESRDAAGWLAADEAAWRARLAPLRLALRDTLAAESLSREVLESYASQVPASGEALALLVRLASGRGEAFSPALARRAAVTEWNNRQRAEALARLDRVLRAAPPAERGADALQRVRWWREWRRPRTALASCDTAARWVTTAAEREALRLERARACRDAGLVDAALAHYQRLGRTAASPRIAITAWWEAGREAQDRSRWREAARAFDRADSLAREGRDGHELARDAGTLAGLMYWLAGDAVRAESRWRARTDRRARFWLAIALRRRGVTSKGDSILRAEFAAAPGYDLYSAAARDTLRLASWPGRSMTVLADTTEPALVDAIVRLAGPLALPEAAARLVAARDRADARVPRRAQRAIAPIAWRAIAAASYAGGDLAGGTRAADRALVAMGRDSVAWEFVPWAFPPAYEPEVLQAAREFGIDPALLWAVTRQESRFDPRAVSRSNARGLTQLLPGTARDMAKALREPFAADTVVFEPRRGLRYGARYIKWLLDRFDGHVAVALTGYNAGAGKVRPDWRELLARGGDMLYVELAANADTQDYVRRILGYRQAYRELAPSGTP